MAFLKRISLWAGCVVVIIGISLPAKGDVVRVVGVDKTDALARSLGLTICQVEAIFDSASDRLLSIGEGSIVTNDANGFWQHQYGTDTAPAQVLINLYPALEHDSFVTIGFKTVPVGGSNSTALDPELDSGLFNTGGSTAGGWFNSNPTNNQGAPNANLRVLIAQLTVRRTYGISGDATIYYNDGLLGFEASFDCFGGVPGGGPNGEAGPADGAGSEEGPQGGSGPEGGGACGDPEAGSCFEAQPTPYCDCTACCEEVCGEQGPTCCTQEWDNTCTELALSLCRSPSVPDCNANNIWDECELEDGLPDCNGDGILDGCDLNPSDPDGNGLVSPDTDANNVPDECQDCNCNFILDPTESPDCNNNEIPDECEVATGPKGPIFLSGHDADEIDHCPGDECGGMYPAILSFAIEHTEVAPPLGTRIAGIGANVGLARTALQNWNDPLNEGPGAGLVFLTDAAVISNPGLLNFSDYSMIHIPSSANNLEFDSSGISPDQLAALNSRQGDVANYVNVLHGGLLALTESGATGAYDWLPVDVNVVDQGQMGVTGARPVRDIALIPNQTANSLNLNTGPYHTTFTRAPDVEDFEGLSCLVISTNTAAQDEVLILGKVKYQTSHDCDSDGTVDECMDGYCPWDLSPSGRVDAADLALLLGAWGPCPASCLAGANNCSCPADFAENCRVNAADLAWLLGKWHWCRCPSLGTCLSAHASDGCDNDCCCNRVCNSGSAFQYCCQAGGVGWDGACAAQAAAICNNPPQDCYP